MELSADHTSTVGSRAPWATTAVDWKPVMEGQALKEGQTRIEGWIIKER